LHVGCGPKRADRTPFAGLGWQEIRLDIDPAVQPDVVGTMLDMGAVAAGSVDAVFSSHNIEHLYPHEVPLALAEFRRVLAPGGFALITCPDLQSVAALVADNKLVEPAYTSPAGPIAPLDILYGLRGAMAGGNLYMAHRCGFTRDVLVGTLQQAGFAQVAARQRPQVFDLWALATNQPWDQAALQAAAARYIPGWGG
jgi:SAM-dependent methyltransferase